MDAVGALRGSEVLVDDEERARRLHSRGFGTMKGSSLALSGPEALFLLEAGRLSLAGGGSLTDLLGALAREDASLPSRWAVYRDLRSRGIAARPGPPGADFIAPARAKEQGGGAEALVLALSESEKLDLPRLCDSVSAARRAKKRLVLGVTDGEGETTWYRVEEVEVSGTVKEPGAEGAAPARAVLVGSRAVVPSPAEAEALEKGGHYGRRVGPLLHLSLVEAMHLLSLGRIALEDARGRAVPGERLAEIATKEEKEFRHLLRAYAILRARRLVPKSGFKFGAHFRAYRRSPDEEHAQYLIHVVAQDDPPTWAEAARAVRLAHGVKKEMVFGHAPPEGELRFFRIQRVKF
jgi:tRNA-intron endonuclease